MRWGCFLIFTGCTITPPPGVPPLSSTSGNFLATGKILYRHPEGKHSGDLDLRFSANGGLRLQIFTPLVGSLVYELRVDRRQLMIVDYNQEWYVLEGNTALSRQAWLGMDLSLEELQWILSAKPPDYAKNGWLLTELASGDKLLQKGRKSIRLRLDAENRIRKMQKMLNGILEYTVTVSQYHPANEVLSPRKVKIADFSGAHEMLMVFSTVARPPSFQTPVLFTPPMGMPHYVPDS